MRPFAAQESHGFDTVRSDVQEDRLVGTPERLTRQPDVSRTVFDQEHLDRPAGSSDGIHDDPSQPDKTKRKVAPSPGCDSTVMALPWRSMIFLQIANPIPVPANSSRLCRR